MTDLVDTDEIESWIIQDLLKPCALLESVSEEDYCQVAMTAIVTRRFRCGVHMRVCAPPPASHRTCTEGTFSASPRTLLLVLIRSEIFTCLTKIELMKTLLLASETGFLVPRSRHRAGIGMGANLGQSGGCPFTKQTDRKLARIVAEASASTNRSSRINPCPL